MKRLITLLAAVVVAIGMSGLASAQGKHGQGKHTGAVHKDKDKDKDKDQDKGKSKKHKDKDKDKDKDKH